MELYTGETLKEKCLEMTAGFDCRDISDFLHALMIDKRERRTIALYGLRRTGKTVMMMQEILRLNDFDRTLFVSIDEEKEDSIQDLRDALAEHPDMRYYVLLKLALMYWQIYILISVAQTVASGQGQIIVILAKSM